MMALAAYVLGLSLTRAQERSITVFAAASLKDAFTAIAQRYEAAHPGVSVRLNFAGSQQLAAQIRQGAEADVFAAAAPAQLYAAGKFASPVRTFAQNYLTLVVANEETRVKSIADVAKVDRLVIADGSVPAGAYTLVALARARLRFGAPWRGLVERRIVSRETDVRAVLSKVILGEADAGFVYVSDARSAQGKVKTVPIPLELNEVATYPVSVPATATAAKDGKDFVNFLFSADSQKTLEDQGFISPLRPVAQLKVVGGLTSKTYTVSHLAKLRDTTVKTKAETGETRAYRGASLPALLKGLEGSGVRFMGADGYSVQVSLKAIRHSGGVLIPMGDGNLQVVLPGQSPSKWVKWLRLIAVY